MALPLELAHPCFLFSTCILLQLLQADLQTKTQATYNSRRCYIPRRKTLYVVRIGKMGLKNKCKLEFWFLVTYSAVSSPVLADGKIQTLVI